MKDDNIVNIIEKKSAIKMKTINKKITFIKVKMNIRIHQFS